MQMSEVPHAVGAATAIASGHGLRVDEAVLLQDANRLVLRLLPCDVVARVTSVMHEGGALFEVEMAQQLAQTDSPVARLEPRVEPGVYRRADFVVTLWTYYPPVQSRVITPVEYAHALERLHDGFRKVDITAPHFTDRVSEAQRLVDDREQSPALTDSDRELLGTTLRRLTRTITGRGAAEQLLHGETHPGNLLQTKQGLLFADLETSCRGPVEFDIAHAPEAVSELYSHADQDLVRACRILVLAMVAAWRWDRGDQFPNGRQMGIELIGQIRAALDRDGL